MKPSRSDRPARRNLIPILGGALLCLALSLPPVLAQSATWSADPGTGDWNTAANWSTVATFPNGSGDTATFDLSSVTAISLSANTEVDGLAFNSGADAFTITIAPTFTLTISGAGVANQSAGTQHFVTDTYPGFLYGSGTLSFSNTATAGDNTTYTNHGSTNGENGDTTPYSSFGGGITQFFNTAQAGSATFTNQGGSDSSNAGGGTTVFHDSSSAGTATITNEGSQTVAAFGGVTVFNDTSSAGSAQVTNQSGSTDSTRGGYTVFNNSADADTGTFISDGGVASGTMGVTLFNNDATAGSAHFTANGAVASGASGGYVIFNDNASAVTADFTAEGGTASGAEGGNIEFYAGTTADQATFTVNGGSVEGAGGGRVYFTDYVAGYGSQGTGATAGTASFTINGGSANQAGGGYVSFEGSATPGQATFVANGGSAGGAEGGSVRFYSGATADHATITANGGTANDENGAAGGGLVLFNQDATAGDSTLIANGGTNGGAGGSIQFFDSADGGNAVVKVYGNGNLDISPVNLYNGQVTVGIGSLEGSGNVFLGNNNLSVGGNGVSTTFSGVLQDSGRYGSGGNGALTKVGAGTLTLSGTSTNTGTVTVNAGTLNVTGSIATSSLTTVNDTATLTGTGTVGGLTLANGGTLAPGDGIGTLFAGSTTLEGGGKLQWQINSVGTGNNLLGQNPGWDLLSINGTLDLAATEGSKFTINLTSLTTGGAAGAVADFDPNANYFFTFAQTTDGIQNFDASAFALNFDGFANSFTGTWSVAVDGNNLDLVYASGTPVPEPATYAVLAGLGVLGFAAWRRRRVA
ncbi:MAG: autotransporter-associated beta strand repeat-containing protein [Verrucomicrobia bacterium]|nr:autotransporter-associated beta strand repeat-containing protein [Verrucomicrobiota bacterium]